MFFRRNTQPPLVRVAALVLAAGTVSGAALAGCSSPSAADRQLRSQSAAVLPMMTRIYRELYGAHVAWGTVAYGQPVSCGLSDPLATSGGKSVIQYTAEAATLPWDATGDYDFQLPLNAPEFNAQVTKRLTADGWNLRRRSSGATVNPVYDYTARSGGLDVEVIVSQDVGSPPGAVIIVSGACFDAGSAAPGLLDDTTPMDTVQLPNRSSAG